MKPAPEPTRFRARPEAPPRPWTRRSTRIPARDGTPLAVDLTLPRDLGPGERLPTILRATRYHRGVTLRGPLDRLDLRLPWDRWRDARRRFASEGYAWVDLDVRGSGASHGRQACPWSPDEVRDGADVVDWILGQPWSNGLVGALGISYDGTAAELLLTNLHPAVRAVAPLFSLFDVYSDVAFPGGIHHAWFTEAWARFNRTLDANRFDVALAQIVGLVAAARVSHLPLPPRALEAATSLAGERLPGLLRPVLTAALSGVRRVDEDPHGALLASALADHTANTDIHEGALRLRDRDDRGLIPSLPDGTADSFSPHARAADLAASGAAIYGVSGWYDAAYAGSAITRFRAVKHPGSRLLLGPWTHSAMLRMVPFAGSVPVAFDLAGELLDFFDLHLKARPNALAHEPAARWAVAGREGASLWRSSGAFPPPEARPWTLHFGPGRALLARPSALRGEDPVAVDRGLGTGLRARWRTLLSPVPADYPDHRERDRRRLVFTSSPLEGDLELAGAPRLSLTVLADATDATVFAYLSDVSPEGEVQYVTEGMLRARHRACSVAPDGALTRTFRSEDALPLSPGEPASLVFDLLPAGYLVRRGHRLRLSLACADRDHFAPPPDDLTALRVRWGGADGATLTLSCYPLGPGGAILG